MAPPSLIIESLAPPGPSLPGGATVAVPKVALGLRKYSAMAAFCSRVPTPMIHITRKNAIIAVTKSA